MSEVLIEVKDLNFKYQNLYILQNINLTINKNEFVVIIGPRGEGKSTFLKILAGLLPVEEGDVIYNNISLKNIAKRKMMALHLKTAFVFQDAALISNMRVFDNIALPLRYNNLYPEEEIQKIINDLLEYVDLQNIRNLLPAFASMGQKKIIALLRALVVKPETVFYDELSANLDKPAQEKLKKLIREHLINNITSIAITHEFKEFQEFITKVIVLKDRTIYKVGGLEEILNSNDPFINSLIE